MLQELYENIKITLVDGSGQVSLYRPDLPSSLIIMVAFIMANTIILLILNECKLVTVCESVSNKANVKVQKPQSNDIVSTYVFEQKL